MIVKQHVARMSFVLWAILLMVGCTEAEPVAVVTTSQPQLVSTTAPEVVPTQALNGDVIVDSAEFVLSNSFPIEVALQARGNLPDGCTTISEKTQDRNGNAFSLALRYTRDPNALCTQALVPFEESFELDVADLRAGTYTVNINGVVQTFVLAIDNIAAVATEAPVPTEEPTAEPTTEPIAASGTFTVTGLVFHDLCAVADQSANASVPAASEGCVEIAENDFTANGDLEEGEPPLIGIAVSLGQGSCDAPEGVISAETDASGVYQFSNLVAGPYCVFVTSVVEPNASVLIPGSWTTHEDEAFTAIDLNANTELPPFGWDYQFLPIPKEQQGETLTRAACVDLFAFDGDVTIPDDSPFEPGQPVVKTWRLINTGSCSWTDGYSLTYLRGDKMDAPDEVVIQGVVVPGEAVDVTVEMIAPSEQGTYRGDWVMKSDFDRLFGVGGDEEDPIWLQITVVEPDTVGQIQGVIWHDRCDQSAYTFGDPTLPAGCLQNTNGTIRADGLYDRDSEEPLADIVLNLGNGTCGETEFIRSWRSSDNGQYTFANLLAGTYCIYIEVLSDNNYSKLIPGNFTVPQPGRSGVTVVLEPNAEFNSINFAWDFLEE